MLRVPCAVLALAAALALPSALAAQEDERPPAGPPPPLAQLYLTLGPSLRQTPLDTKFGEVLGADARVGMPLKYGLEPWISGAVARSRIACDTTAGASCSRVEKRLLGGLLYHAGGDAGPDRGTGPYVGAGLGVQSFRGASGLAHTIILGLPVGGTRRLSPLFELRVESHEALKDVLMITFGARFGAGR